MKNNLKWRLSKLPTVEELLKLVNDKIITQEEAKEILFKNETDESRDIESLKEEIKFLRDLITSLSHKNYIQEKIYYYSADKYKSFPWFSTYYNWSSSIGGPSTCTYTHASLTGDNMLVCNSSDATNSINLNSATEIQTCSNDFTDLKTF